MNGEIKKLSLNDYKGLFLLFYFFSIIRWLMLVVPGKYLVFFFYPLDFTFVCPSEIIAFNDRIEEFRAIGAEVVACSVDSKYVHVAWTKTPRSEGELAEHDSTASLTL